MTARLTVIWYNQVLIIIEVRFVIAWWQIDLLNRESSYGCKAFLILRNTVGAERAEPELRTPFQSL